MREKYDLFIKELLTNLIKPLYYLSVEFSKSSLNIHHLYADYMERRNFIQTLGDTLTEKKKKKEQLPLDEIAAKYANKEVPTFARSFAGLEPYAGTWGADQAAHLLRRSLFGPAKAEILAAVTKGLNTQLDELLAASPAPLAPIDTKDPLAITLNQTWVDKAYDANKNFDRLVSFKEWWMGLIITQPVSLREKMVLFWHNHFVTASFEINDARYSYKYSALLRSFAFGNFKELAKQITIDPAMLVYLNGNTNTGKNSNENYARELLELFSIGKGQEIGPGNYTNYTEEDVVAASKVLSGWKDSRENLNSSFNINNHNIEDKQFSSAFNNKLIASNGAAELDELLDMIFAQPETARYICRKLYRFFVYYVIDETTEANVIEPMAELLRTNNYEIKPVLKALFSSAHFYDPINTGCMIKNPLEHTAGLCRQYDVVFPTAMVDKYKMWLIVYYYISNLQLVLGDPPNVAGWSAYYQAPLYHETWINSDTITFRNQISDAMIYTYGIQFEGSKINIDPVAFAEKVSDPADVTKLINEFASTLFPLPLSDAQKAYLKESLIPGLPDYEWQVEWNDYKANPTEENKEAVAARLRNLLKFMMSMAEYHLC